MVRSRLLFTKDNPLGFVNDEVEVEATYNMSLRDYRDRLPDMEITLDDGQRMTIQKEYIAAVVELKAVRREEGKTKVLKEEKEE